MMKKRMMRTRMERLAGTLGWMLLAVVVALGVTGCGRDPLMAKAKKAEKAGNINFFGFYTGMPREDADALATRHSLTGVDGLVNFALSWDLGFHFLFGLDDASMFHENPETHEVYAMLFSLQDVQRMTKAGTFKELGKAISKQVGELEYDGKVAKRKNPDGVALYIFKEQQFCILFDETRAKAARAVNEREKQREEERAKLEAQRAAEQKAAEAKAKLEALNEKLRAANEKMRSGETRKPGDIKTIELPGGATMEMVWCPPGAFMMGSPEGEEGRDRDEKQHIVVLANGFWMGKTEVTQTQWESVMGRNDSQHKRPGQDLPVEQVKWNHCLEFCLKAGLQLPTEAEWEYACRAGSTGTYGGTGTLDEMGWYDNNSANRTHPVGKKLPNAWGLYDMHGNVTELCADWYTDYPEDTVVDPIGLLDENSSWNTDGWHISGSGHIEGRSHVPQINVRGGSWDAGAVHCRSAYRETCGLQGYQDYDSPKAGFRVCFHEGPRRAEKVAQEKIAVLNEKLRANETRKPGDTAKITLPGGATLEMVWCPPGAFLMGSPLDELGREEAEKQHLVTLSEGFWMGKTEITQVQWKSVMGDNPANHEGDETLPVENVSWNQCNEFCQLTGLRLPTEAQWEYACRAGSTGAFGGTGRPNEMAQYDEWGWYSHYHGRYGDKTQPVGQKKPNAWGLYDMHGNVKEWCAGWYAAYPEGAVTDPTGPDDADERISRGGSYKQCAFHCRSATRFCAEYEINHWRGEYPDTYGSSDQGFRVCCTAAEMSAIVEKQRADEARQPKAGERKTITLPGGAKMEMVWCPPGTFTMGSPKTEKGRDDDETQHQVTLLKGFWMAKTEVTQAQWKSVMGGNPSKHKGSDALPVDNVEWHEARDFCKKAGLQLPTESEWEYACRAGNTGAVSGGGWDKTNSEEHTHPVGQKKPNAWGLHDMHGNVWEWCGDLYADYPNGRVTNPHGPKYGPGYVRRGGSSKTDSCYCRSANRGWWPEDESVEDGNGDFGFRPILCGD